VKIDAGETREMICSHTRLSLFWQVMRARHAILPQEWHVPMN
jgi:hypothetical protein